MTSVLPNFLPALHETIEQVRAQPVPTARKTLLQPLIDAIQSRVTLGQRVALHFICTHNSRRSQFAQIWAHTAATYYTIPVQCYSGGIEVTAFHPFAVAAIRRNGFEVPEHPGENPSYAVCLSDDLPPITAYSKRYDSTNYCPSPFVAVMTCSHVDDHCPVVLGADLRIPVYYEDPGAYDDSPERDARYDERSLDIARDLFYVFSHIQPSH